MLFLVRGEYIDAGPLLPPQQAIDVVEQAVVPSFQMLAQQAGVTGGIYAGERAGAFMIEADSPEDLDSLLNHLPFFGLVKFDVKTIVPVATVAEMIPQYLSDVRSQMQPGDQSTQG